MASKINPRKRKHFDHPGIEHPLVQLLETVEDPRGTTPFFRYSLTSILFMILMTMMCGATDWQKVIVMAEGMREWMGKYVDMTAGVPCMRTFIRVMNILQPEALEKVLRELSILLREKLPGEVVSFDGQTVRGTADQRTKQSGIHLVSAWSAQNCICLGQIKVDDKTNEITAMPELMRLLDLRDTIVTADALNTQKAIAEQVIQQKGDYLLPVKGNQPTLRQEIIGAFQVVDSERALADTQWKRAMDNARRTHDSQRLQKLMQSGSSMCGSCYYQEEAEKDHGRIEYREYLAVPSKNIPSREEWARLESLIRVRRTRIRGDKEEHEVIYYISSLPATEVEAIGHAARQHWRVENSLHWRLDVVFRQDHSRYRDRVGARNLATLRKMTLNALSKETSLKGGLATRQCAAACNPGYREKVLRILFS